MSVDIYPPIAPPELELAVQDAQSRERTWLLDDLHATLADFKHGLEDCYALLAPIDPGSTLVVSTPRTESVKGHVTRVGTRIVKGTLSLRLRTQAAQTLSLDPTHPIHLAPLTLLHARLTDALDVLTRTLELLPEGRDSSGGDGAPTTTTAAFVSAQLRLISSALQESSAILKGPPLTELDPGWTTLSAAPGHFLAPPSPPPPTSNLNSFLSAHTHQQQAESAAAAAANPLENISVYFSIQDSSLVLWVRALEPADAAPSLGMKFALAIGTARRLEHDESDVIFGYCCAGLDGLPPDGSQPPRHPGTSPKLITRRPPSRTGPPVLSGNKDSVNSRSSSRNPGGTAREKDPHKMQVYVREKIRVESADPSLMSLSAKLNALSHTLIMARRNLAAVMGEELQD